jgi:hypothetical protein
LFFRSGKKQIPRPQKTQAWDDERSKIRNPQQTKPTITFPMSGLKSSHYMAVGAISCYFYLSLRGRASFNSSAAR